jgi:hypothetical protein
MDKENTTHTVEYRSSIKSENLSFAAKWMEAEDIMLHKTSQTQREKGGTPPYVESQEKLATG